MNLEETLREKCIELGEQYELNISLSNPENGKIIACLHDRHCLYTYGHVEITGGRDIDFLEHTAKQVFEEKEECLTLDLKLIRILNKATSTILETAEKTKHTSKDGEYMEKLIEKSTEDLFVMFGIEYGRYSYEELKSPMRPALQFIQDVDLYVDSLLVAIQLQEESYN